jgi:hypothetical protein
MSDAAPVRRELKELFLRELTPYEKIFFLRKAEEAIRQKGYSACEDLFHFCYFLTLKDRMLSISTSGNEGYVRYIHAEAGRNLEDTIRLYEDRLNEKKNNHHDDKGRAFIEYLSE